MRAPFDTRPIARITTADARALEQALKTAQALFADRDSWLSPADRIAVLEQSTAIMTRRSEELARGAAREGGKSLIDSRIEVARAIDSLKGCVETLRTDAGR